MASTMFSLSTSVTFVVEERRIDNPGKLEFAYSCESKQEAETLLLELVRANGAERFYTAYILVD